MITVEPRTSDSPRKYRRWEHRICPANGNNIYVGLACPACFVAVIDDCNKIQCLYTEMEDFEDGN